MEKTKYRRKQRYKTSLYSNLLAACVASEIKDDVILKPKMVVKDEPLIALENEKHTQTFVMRWNPEISNHKVADFEFAMENFYDEGFYYDWSIWDYDKVHVGDHFYMLKVGNGNTGIVMSGIIVSMSYKDEDWSGKGRDVRYVRMIPDCMIHPEKAKLITTQTLDKLLPGVKWNEGHSGVLLNDTQSKVYDELWNKFMNVKPSKL